MNKISILITTYNRPEMLLQLLRNIKRGKRLFDITIYIYNDGSTHNYQYVLEYLDYLKIKYIYLYNSENNGKQNYWKTINNLYGLIANGNDSDYYIQLPDDVELIDDFFTKSIFLFDNIQDSKKICLNLSVEEERRGKRNWTNFDPVEKTFNDKKYYLSGWVDMCFISKKNFFENINYNILSIQKSIWDRNPNMSSCLGSQITNRLNDIDCHLYQVYETLVFHGDHPSMMNPIERKLNPLNCK